MQLGTVSQPATVERSVPVGLSPGDSGKAIESIRVSLFAGNVVHDNSRARTLNSTVVSSPSPSLFNFDVSGEEEEIQAEKKKENQRPHDVIQLW